MRAAKTEDEEEDDKDPLAHDYDLAIRIWDENGWRRRGGSAAARNEFPRARAGPSAGSTAVEVRGIRIPRTPDAGAEKTLRACMLM
jgi:hypothetical protein